MAHHPTPNSAAAAWITRLEPSPSGQAATAGPLAGLRFAIKDNIDLAHVPTTAACPAFAYTPDRHAHVVERLIAAGATPAGKTNLDQFACGLNGTRSPYGAVPNSFDAQLVSGGSSSGSAYVVATGQVDFALGTDTAGSGRVPAGLNNIVGLKPSKGLLSARGVVPAAQSVDCVSILARTVGTALRVLHAARGFDAADPYSRELALEQSPFPARFRFGVPDALKFFGDVAAAQAFDDAISKLIAMGGTPITIDYAPLGEAASLLYDSALVAERYAAVRGFFDQHEADVMEPVRGILAAGRRYSAADLVDAQTRLRALAQRAAPMWETIDLLLVPTAPTHYSIAAMQADPVVLNRNLGAYTNFVNLLDYAAISVPSSIRADGLPFGITLIGPCGADLQLAELGQLFHHASGLPLGATGLPLPEPVAVFAPAAAPGSVRVAVVGAHLSGMPLNGQLRERGATLVEATTTAPLYRLYALAGTVPPKPGMARVPAEEGVAIDVEVWEMPVALYGSFVALIPWPLGIGRITLADGSAVQGFVCEQLALAGAEDISHHGGWRNYLAARASANDGAGKVHPSATGETLRGAR
ncbi:allophanate hydrolase [Oxalobacteraceae bacterium]|nr:allophanate hydrolase [Oxalobacteraceae bacterium]